jgi:hypothetical protein
MNNGPIWSSGLSARWTNSFFAIMLFAGTLALLATVYCPVLLETFVYADEHHVLSSPNSDRSIWSALEGGLRRLGRPVSIAVFMAYKRIAGEGWTGLLWVRATALVFTALFITTASIILGLAWRSKGVAFATTIFLVGTQSVQVTAFYSMLSPYMLGHAAAACAAALVMFPTDRRGAFWLRCGIALVMLEFSWFVFQVSPFMAGPIAAAIALASLVRDKRPLVLGQITVATLLTATMVIFLVIYNAFSNIKYHRAKNAVEMVDYVSRLDFSLLFETFKIGRILETAYVTDLLAPLIHRSLYANLAIIGVTTLLIFFIFVVLSLMRDRIYSATHIMSIGLSVALLVSAYVPLVADNFSPRQHVWLPATVSWWAVLVTSFFLVQAWLSRDVRLRIRGVAIAVGVALGLGHLAMGGLAVKLRVADPYGKQVSYMQRHFAEEYGGASIDQLRIVLPDREKVGDVCLLEPCIGFYARGPMEVRRWRNAVPMRELARRAGIIAGPVEVVAVQPQKADSKTLRLDTFALESFRGKGHY